MSVQCADRPQERQDVSESHLHLRQTMAEHRFALCQLWLQVLISALVRGVAVVQ